MTQYLSHSWQRLWFRNTAYIWEFKLNHWVSQECQNLKTSHRMFTNIQMCTQRWVNKHNIRRYVATMVQYNPAMEQTPISITH